MLSMSTVWIYASELILVFLGRFVDLKHCDRVVMFVVAKVKGPCFEKRDSFSGRSFL